MAKFIINSMYKLNPKEHKELKVLTIILSIVLLIILKRVYNKRHDTNQDFVLVPVAFALSIFVCIRYCINAFSTGNIVKNWASKPVFKTLFNLINKNGLKSEEEVMKATTRVFGFFMLTVIIVLIIFLIRFYIR